MNDTELIERLRQLAKDHEQCDTYAGECSLQEDLERILAQNPPAQPNGDIRRYCHVLGCTSILTITDVGDTCRQCVLEGKR